MLNHAVLSWFSRAEETRHLVPNYGVHKACAYVGVVR